MWRISAGSEPTAATHRLSIADPRVLKRQERGKLEKFYERGRQEKNLLLIWQPDFFLTTSPAVLGVSCAMGRRHSLSIEPVRTSARLIPPSLPVNVASMATMVLLVTRSL